MLCVGKTSLPPHQKNNLPASGHFVDEGENTSKPVCIKSYTKSMGFVDSSDIVTCSS